MTKHYLVTGAAGFIGSRVSHMLLDAGHRVSGIDDLNASYDPHLKEWRLSQLKCRPYFQFKQLDFTDLSAVDQIFNSAIYEGDINKSRVPGSQNSSDGSVVNPEKWTPFAAVFHLGARPGVQPSVRNPHIYLRTNIEGTLNLLELCRQYGVQKFVLASTSSLYGAHNQVPFSEEADTSFPLSPYAASKKAAEALAFTYHHLHGIDVSVLRYFTVYGPAGRPDMCIFRFIRQISAGETILLFGDGEQQRDFTYVDDIARGTIAAVKPVGFEVINLGGDRLTSINSLIGLIAQIVSSKPTIERRPAHSADVPSTWANVQKARRLLNWTPHISLEEGLRRTVEWHKENHQLVSTLRLDG